MSIFLSNFAAQNCLSMKRILLFVGVAFFSMEIIAYNPLDSLPCYCVDLVELMGGNDETELSEEDVKALERDNIYFSDRKDCLAKFLVSVKPQKKSGPKEKPLPLFVAQKLGLWGYMNVGRNSFAQSYLAVAKLSTVGQGKELYKAMQSDTALARPMFNALYERYYGNRNEQIRVNSLHDMGFTYPEIDQMEEIGYAHYRVLEYARKNPSIPREELIKEGFEAEKAFDGHEYSEEELKDYLKEQDAANRMSDMFASEKEKESYPYYRGKLKLKSWSIKKEWEKEFRSCQVADLQPCYSSIVVHIDKKGIGRLECTEDAPALVKYFYSYASQHESPSFVPVKLQFAKIKESVDVNFKGKINIVERRIFDGTGEVKIAYKDGQWELVKSPDNWDKIPLLNYIRSMQLENKTKKSKLTLTGQIIRRYINVGHLGACELAPIYQFVSSNDKNLQFDTYEESRVRW